MQQEPKIKINPDNTIIVTVSNGTAYTLREPLAKDMAGLGQDLIKIKHTETIQKLLSKISTPKIGMAQYGGFSMADAQALNAAVDFFFSAAVSESRDSGSLCGIGLYPRFRYRADTFSRLINSVPDIWEDDVDGEQQKFYQIDDALALCAITFKGSIDWFAEQNLYRLNSWAAKAEEINRIQSENAGQ